MLDIHHEQERNRSNDESHPPVEESSGNPKGFNKAPPTEKG